MIKTSWQQKRSSNLKEGVYDQNPTANYFATRNNTLQEYKLPGHFMDRKKTLDQTAGAAR
jgi:hypothetical protein